MAFVGEPRAADIRDRWGWFVGFGVVIAILGLLALWNAVDATLVTTIFVGWLLVIAGIAHLVGAFTGPGAVGWRAVQGLLGLLYVLVGLDIVFDPLAGTIAITIVIALLLIIDGVARIWTALSDRMEGWGWVMALGVIDILLGLWLWTGIPFTGVAIGIFVGLQLLIAGVSWMAAGFAARSLADTSASRTT